MPATHHLTDLKERPVTRTISMSSEMSDTAKSDASESFDNSKPAVSPPNEDWGTRQRLDSQFSRLEQAGLDEMIDRAMKRSNAPRFITRYHPQSSWLWRQWQGTVLQQTWKPAASMTLVALALVLFMEPVRMTGTHTWAILEVPNEDDKGIKPMRGFTTMWGYLLTMATFVNSFFLSQACE